MPEERDEITGQPIAGNQRPDPAFTDDERELFKQPGREPMSEDAISVMQRAQADLLDRFAALSKGEGAVGSVQGVPGWTHSRPDASPSPSLYDRVTKLEHAVEALSRYLTKSDGD
jgi:proteasome lid subunit RPN8/RPN11